MARKLTPLRLIEEKIINKIYLIRGKKVMLDFELSEMYDVETKQLKRQVRRNFDRFPKDFMFTLRTKEFENLRSQIGTSNWGGTRYMPMAFTEQGVAMLSSVLGSPTAIAVNIEIIRVFSRMKEMLLSHKDVLLKLEKIEQEIKQQDSRNRKNEENIETVFRALKQLLNPPSPPPRPRIGFKPW
jgi:hypothetical protein